MQEEERLNSHYWEMRYAQHKTDWDIGHVSPPLKSYFDQLENKQLKMLIPGAGNAYEAEYLYQQGFKNVVVADIARQPLTNLQLRCSEIPGDNLLLKDFFDLEPAYDLIIEQTFFCALQPALRPEYVQQMKKLLKPGGKLAGVLFDRTFIDNPPFGGTAKEYEALFAPHFRILHLAPCYNSLPGRKEVFIELEKK